MKINQESPTGVHRHEYPFISFHKNDMPVKHFKKEEIFLSLVKELYGEVCRHEYAIPCRHTAPTLIAFSA
jgi:hypothetical protein